MSQNIRGFAFVCAVLVLGCSGRVVFVDDDGGDGGASAGGAGEGVGVQGASPAEGGSPPLPPGPTGSGGGFDVPQTECGIACDVLFQCGLQPSSEGIALCPGFEPGDQEGFSNFCVPQCEALSGAVSFIDGTDCEGTVTTVASVSAEFADLCSFGL